MSVLNQDHTTLQTKSSRGHSYELVEIPDYVKNSWTSGCDYTYYIVEDGRKSVWYGNDRSAALSKMRSL